jgi:adenylate cyclase
MVMSANGARNHRRKLARSHTTIAWRAEPGAPPAAGGTRREGALSLGEPGVSFAKADLYGIIPASIIDFRIFIERMDMVPTPVVLLVDDEPDTVRLVRKILQADGCQVIEAVDGDAAYAAYTCNHPDLILLDIILPHRDGLDVLRAIRQTDPITGIIMVSALTSERMTIDAMLSGADDYISKPFPLREMRVRIRQVLEKTALRRDNAALQSQLERANGRIREMVERFMPAPVMAELMDCPDPPVLGGRRQELTALFADIRHFTPLAESMPPDELVEILNHYLQLLARAIEAHGGTIDKFMGDGVLALYNAPTAQPDHALRAVETARDIVCAFEGTMVGGRRLSVAIGINTGDVVVGNIGTPQLMNYTAIGAAVNLSQRLQEAAGANEIILGARTAALVNGQIATEELPPLVPRGLSESVRAWRVMSRSSSVSELPSFE